MSRPFLTNSASIFLFCAATLAAAQSFQPKAIQFKGDPDHTNAELMAAAGLKPGSVFTAAEMNDHTKQLMDSGVFDNITYTFNGQDLIFKLIPTGTLYPIRLENLPLANDSELESRLRARLPLFHGKVPLEGGLVDGVRQELEEELIAKGIQAKLTAAPYSDLSQKIVAISFSIISPAVQVGEIQLEGASPAIAEKARVLAAKSIGSAYSTDGSPSQLETSISNFYHELGYLQASVHATAMTTPVVDQSGVNIPFSAKVDEGPKYRLESVQLAPDLVVTQAAFDRQSGLHPGDVVSPEKLRGNWMFINRQYHNKGFMKAQVRATPIYAPSQGTVSFAVAVDPGAVYAMGTLNVDNLSGDLRAAFLAAWKIPEGAPFNEGAILSLGATHGVNPIVEKVLSVANLRYSLNVHDDSRTVDVHLLLEKRQ